MKCMSKSAIFALLVILAVVVLAACQPARVVQVPQVPLQELPQEQVIIQEPPAPVAPAAPAETMPAITEQSPAQQAPSTSVIAAQSPKPVVPVKTFTMEGDDYGLYPGSITVNKGDDVRLTLIARSRNIYNAGLDFKGGPWGTITLAPGESKTVEFVADRTFSFDTYWPSSGVHKATGTVIVGSVNSAAEPDAGSMTTTTTTRTRSTSSSSSTGGYTGGYSY